MTTEVKVALISTTGLVLVALIGLIVEQVRTRRGNKREHKSVLVELAAVIQAQDEIKSDVAAVADAVKQVQVDQAETRVQLARLEGQVGEHLRAGERARR